MRSNANEPDAVSRNAASRALAFPTSVEPEPEPEPEPESAAWHRQPDESLTWYARFDLFRLMPSPRSVAAIYQREQKGAKGSKKTPGKWHEMAKAHRWTARAEAWDAWERARIEAQRQAYVDSILQEGYALVHERVKTLSTVAHQLLGYIGEPDKVFLPDVKSIGYGEFTERVDLVNFNDALFEQYRKYVADIAAEMGGRVKQVKQEATVAIDVTGAKDSLFNKLAAFAKKSASASDEHEHEHE